MNKNDYLALLVERIHSAAVATLASDGHPQIRTIDMMLWDEEGVYFLTAKGKSFYAQLMQQKYIAVSATAEKRSVSLRGKVKNIGSEKLEEIFEKNPYMAEIYPGDTRAALEVFCLYEGKGEYFDISDPAHIQRDHFVIGNTENTFSGYIISEKCVGCGACDAVCPQGCIHMEESPAQIDQNRCLHCGRCAEVCPVQAVERKGLL